MSLAPEEHGVSSPQIPSHDPTIHFPTPPGGEQGEGPGMSKWLIGTAVVVAVLLVAAVVLFFKSGDQSPPNTQATTPLSTPPTTPRTSASSVPTRSTTSSSSGTTGSTTSSTSTSATTSTTATTSSPSPSPTPTTTTTTQRPTTYLLTKNYRPEVLTWNYPPLPPGWQESLQPGIRSLSAGQDQATYILLGHSRQQLDDRQATEAAFADLLNQLKASQAQLRSASQMAIPLSGTRSTVVFAVRNYLQTQDEAEVEIRIAARCMGKYVAAVAYSAPREEFSEHTWHTLTTDLSLKEG